MKYYEVANYANGYEYVNENSDISDVEKIWTTPIPWNFKPAEGYSPTPVFKFNNRSDAVRIKDALQSVRKDEWFRNKRFYIMNNEKSPKWKVYLVNKEI